MNKDEIKYKLKEIIEKKRKCERNEKYSELFKQESELKQQLNLSVREEFIERHNNFSKKYMHLIMLVGASPEPLIRTILSIKPEKVSFIYTKDVESFLDKVVSDAGLKASEYDKVKVDGSNPGEIYDVVKKYAIKYENLAVDVSGGKKSMTAGMSIAAAFYGIPILYNDYKEYDASLRMPKPGTEFLDELKNPYESSQDQLNRIAENLFKQTNYHSAGDIFKEASDKAESKNRLILEVKSNLSYAYHYWDVFNFKSASGYMNTVLELLKYSDIDAERYKKQFEILKKSGRSQKNYFKSLKDIEESRVLTFSYYASALRRADSQKFEDAVLRLYRCCELIAQHRLALQDINTSDVKWGDIDDIVKEKYKKIYSDTLQESKRKSTPEDVGLQTKIGLFAGYVLLKTLEDEFFNDSIDLKEIFNCLDIRNLSYIEHGVETVNEKKFKVMKNMTDKCVMRLCKINKLNFEFSDFKFSMI